MHHHDEHTLPHLTFLDYQTLSWLVGWLLRLFFFFFLILWCRHTGNQSSTKGILTEFWLLSQRGKLISFWESCYVLETGCNPAMFWRPAAKLLCLNITISNKISSKSGKFDTFFQPKKSLFTSGRVQRICLPMIEHWFISLSYVLHFEWFKTIWDPILV